MGAAAVVPLRVLVVGAARDVGDLRTALSSTVPCEHAESLLAGLARVRMRAPSVVALSAHVADPLRDAVSALRRAGVPRVVTLHRTGDGHRARRAVAHGADAAVELPTWPGEVEGLLRLFAARDAAERDGAVDGTTRTAVGSLVGEIAALHRNTRDGERLLDQVHASFRRRSGATRVSIMTVDEDSRTATLRRASGLPDNVPWSPVPLGEGFAGQVAVTGRPMLVRDVARLGRPHGAHVAGREGYESGSFLVLPLRGAEGVVGVACMADRPGGRPFDDADLRVLTLLADQAGQALENARALDGLRRLAVVDELTGLYNRRYFREALAREVQRARRYSRPLTLALFDLDRFKAYNDTCGHPAGDRALAQVGRILRTSLREVDIVARHGGEEFAVLLPETSAAVDASPRGGARNPFPFLERLRRNVEKAEFPGEERLPEGRLTVSGGLACLPADTDDAGELQELADRALYESKSGGRNRITYRGRTLSEHGA